MRIPCPSPRSLALACCLVAAVGAAQAQWIWRDANGRVTASDLPPPRDVPDERIIQRPAARRAAPPPAEASAPASAPARVDAELEKRRRAAEAEQQAQQQAKQRADERKLAAARADNCRRARGQLIALESGRRLARINERGEREVLDDRGRAEEIRRAQEVVSAECR